MAKESEKYCHISRREGVRSLIDNFTSLNVNVQFNSVKGKISSCGFFYVSCIINCAF